MQVWHDGGNSFCGCSCGWAPILNNLKRLWCHKNQPNNLLIVVYTIILSGKIYGKIHKKEKNIFVENIF